jgi:lysyl-tRNA synthetase class 2
MFFTVVKIMKTTCDISQLKFRSQVINQIRRFFAERNVLEVETPLLCSSTATDPHIQSFSVKKYPRYLQTSPEFAMKRLLAAGSGAIFQICKAFRDDEIGRLHNPEFTILEWYQPGFSHCDLMQEVDDLLQLILNTEPGEEFTYQQIFMKYLNLNPHRSTIAELQDCAHAHHLTIDSHEYDKDTWLQLLMTHIVEPQLGNHRPTFVYDFPASQSALAKIRFGENLVAERFEVYVHGIELANGYHELTNANEQRQRFISDLTQRQKLGYDNAMPIDEKLLSALASGFPDCAGVALGVDRLVMLAAKVKSIAETMSFVWNQV